MKTLAKSCWFLLTRPITKPWPLFLFRIFRANLVGAALVSLLLGIFFPYGLDTRQVFHIDINQFILFALCALGASAFCMSFITWYCFPIVQWQNKPPGTPSSVLVRKRILNLPFIQTTILALSWATASVIILWRTMVEHSILSLYYLTALISGAVISCTISYFQAERTISTLRSTALVGMDLKSSRLGIQSRLLIIWFISNGIPLAGIGFICLGTITSFVNFKHTRGMLLCIFMLTGIAITIGILMVYRMGVAIVSPLTTLQMRLSLLEQGDYHSEIPNYDLMGIGELHSAVDTVAHELADKEHVAELFSKYVGNEVAQQAIAEGIVLGGQEKEVAVVFIDMVDSTALTSTLEPKEMVNQLNQFFNIVVKIANKYKGLVNKFIGDAALIIFNAPADHPNYHSDALAMSRELSARLSAEIPEIVFGIGISSGSVIAGLIGATQRLEYTVIGDAVNEASRLVDIAKRNHTPILVSASTVQQATEGEQSYWTQGESVLLRGRQTLTDTMLLL